MITAQEIKQKAQRLYAEVLRSGLTGQPYFPKTIRGNKTPAKDFTALRQQMAELMAGSKARTGFGYTVQLETVNTRKHGSQDLPTAIIFEQLADYLRFVNKTKEYQQFITACRHSTTQLPQLSNWLAQHPLLVVEHLPVWADVVLVCQWFVHHHTPNRYYIRELPIAVHTKFIEQHSKVMRKLLDYLIPEKINPNATRFEARYQLKDAEQMVRFRYLDAQLQQGPYQELSVPVSQFSAHQLLCTKVVIIENLMNYLTYPPQKNTIAIWGQGFASGGLAGASWLSGCQLTLWADIDVQGFEMLSLLREAFGHVQPFLMDTATMEQFEAFVVQGTPTKASSIPAHLTDSEAQLYQHLSTNNLRLEQERIPHQFVLNCLKK